MQQMDDKEFLADLQAHFATVPFFQFLGARVVRLARGEVEVKLAMRPEYANTYGIGHGGVVAACRLVQCTPGLYEGSTAPGAALGRCARKAPTRCAGAW